jgi:hypothetical protein
LAASSDLSVATASVSGSTLTVQGVGAGIATITVVDASGSSVKIIATVGSSTALYTTAPSIITVATGAASNYSISGGSAPYTVTSSNTSIVTTTGSSTTASPSLVLQINAIAAGTANVVVTDSVGAIVKISVTVTPVATTPIAVTPNNATGSVGDTLNFVISGGTPGSGGYVLTNNNPSIAFLSAGTVSASGGTFTMKLLNVGSTTISIVDSLGQAVTLTIVAAAPVPTLRLSPSALSVGEDYLGNIVLYIYGGTGPYTAYTSDLVGSSVSVGTLPNTITVGLGTQGSRCFTATPTLAIHDQIITVVDTLGASAITKITLQDNTRGGAGCL